MKRVLIVAAAVAVLAGCASAKAATPLKAVDLARQIPKATLSEATMPIVSTPDYAEVSCYGTGRDVIATFPTKGARTTWAQAMATHYDSRYNFQRVDGDRPGIFWTLFTAASSSSTRGYPDSNIADAQKALSGTIRLIGSPE